MAANLPIPLPPRTPTPPSDDAASNDADPGTTPAITSHDPDTLTPLTGTLAVPHSSPDVQTGDFLSPTKVSFSPNSLNDGATSPATPEDIASPGPFNFKTTVLAKSPVMKSVSVSSIILTVSNC